LVLFPLRGCFTALDPRISPPLPGYHSHIAPHPSQQRRAARGEGVSIPHSRSKIDFEKAAFDRRVWKHVSRSPLRSLWNLQGVPVRTIAARTWRAILDDRLFGHAAELGFYFLFALFPTLFCAASILGLAARSAHQIYDRLLDSLALVIPTSALGAVLSSFNQTAAASSSGKITFGLLVAIWSASSGISAIQDTLNDVNKIGDSRSYFAARIYAIALTLLLIVLVTLGLAAIFGGNLLGRHAYANFSHPFFADTADLAARLAGRAIALAFLVLSFAVIYHWAPDWERRRWHWLTPGGTIGILGWLAASFGLRAYLHFFNNYSLTYGSLGAVIILLTWFYITGLMLLLGAEINSEIEAAVAGKRLTERSRGDHSVESLAAESPAAGSPN
jgi:membrane protein